MRKIYFMCYLLQRHLFDIPDWVPYFDINNRFFIFSLPHPFEDYSNIFCKHTTWQALFDFIIPLETFLQVL